MAQADKEDQKSRTFSKKVGDQTLTREVTNAESEVAARFDGYAEKQPTKTSAAASTTSNRSAGSASS